MLNVSKFFDDLKKEYSHIVFPKYSEVIYITSLVFLVVIFLSILINITDSVIGYIFNLIMF